MASVERHVERKVTETVTYRLEISESEARTLAVVLARVGGSEPDSPRGHTQAILDALKDRGVHYRSAPENGIVTGHLMFEDDTRG